MNNYIGRFRLAREEQLRIKVGLWIILAMLIITTIK